MSKENDKTTPEQKKELQELRQLEKTIGDIKRTILGYDSPGLGLPTGHPVTPRLHKKLDTIIDKYTELVDEQRTYAFLIELYHGYLDILTELIQSKEYYVRASEPLLRQTIGQTRKKKQLTLFDQITSEDPALYQDLIESNITSIGAELSVQGRYALQAIQTEFTKAGYEGPIKLTIPEYLDTYGVKKKNYGRGKLEYHPEERKQALEALEELNKPRFWYYKKLNQDKTEKAKGKKYYDIISGKEPIVTIIKGYQKVDEAEAEQIMTGQERNDKLTHLELRPSKIFSYSRFILIPEHIFKTVRRLYKKPSKHLLTFIDVLIFEASHKDYKIKRYYMTLAEQLRLTYLIENRQKKRLYKSLEEDFNRAKELGLLTEYTLGEDMKGKYVELTLNPKAFYHDKKAVKALQQGVSDIEAVPVSTT